jgi:hypothetical protein
MQRHRRRSCVALMSPAKRKPVRRRRSPPPPAPPPHADPSLTSLTLLVGQIAGKLEAHITDAMHDRAEREDDRRAGAQYRSDVRKTLGDLTEGVGKIAGLETRVAAVEKIAGDYKSFRNKLAGVVLAAGFFWAIAAEKIKKVLFS